MYLIVSKRVNGLAVMALPENMVWIQKIVYEIIVELCLSVSCFDGRISD